MALAAEQAGAVAVRSEGIDNRVARSLVSVPVSALSERDADDSGAHYPFFSTM